MRYFFHVGNHTRNVYPDESGTKFEFRRSAELYALVVASELAEDVDWDGFYVLVIDEHGKEIVRVPITVVRAQ